MSTVIYRNSFRFCALTSKYLIPKRTLASGPSRKPFSVFFKTVGCVVSAGVAWFMISSFKSYNTVHAYKSRKKEEDPVIKTVKLTSRERRFIKFASVEFDGQLYMTPQDFLESFVEEEPRPRLKRRVLSPKELESIKDSTPALNKGSSHLFRNLRDGGILSYTEYLFLLSILTKPQTGFRIAFNMFDTDGNERVDKTEFLVILKLLGTSTHRQKELRKWLEDESKTEGQVLNNHLKNVSAKYLFNIFENKAKQALSVNINLFKTLSEKKLNDAVQNKSEKKPGLEVVGWDVLGFISTSSLDLISQATGDMEKIFSHAWRDKRGLTDDSSESSGDKKPNEEFVNDEQGLQRRHKVDTTLIVHFFGKKGDKDLHYEGFRRFMENLQTEVLEMEFHEFAKGSPTISEMDFARILLRYTYLDTNAYDEYLDRLLERLKSEKGMPPGISFDEYKVFFQFLNNLEDFTIAMRMYTLADHPISQEEFHRAVKICTGTSLSKHLVSTVFAIFDDDGDGQLSYREFIAIMKDRLHRGFKSYAKNEGWEAFKSCLKQEIKTPT